MQEISININHMEFQGKDLESADLYMKSINVIWVM